MDTAVIFVLGIFYTCYGVAGLFGMQNIAEKFKGYRWTARYKRFCGIGWLSAGILWLIAHDVIRHFGMGFFESTGVLLLFSLPSMVYAFLVQKRYNKKIKEEKAYRK